MSVINYPSDSYLSVIRCNDSRTACPNQPHVLHLISVAVSDSEATKCNRIISAFEENSKWIKGTYIDAELTVVPGKST